MDLTDSVGFEPHEIITSEPTRSARLKWVIIVDDSISAGLMANAVACISATTGTAVAGLIGSGGPDASGRLHCGLPWAGCSVLTASPRTLAEIRAKAVASDGVLVVDMPRGAQTTRVYDEYLARLAETKPEDLAVSAISVVGPKNRVSKLAHDASLME